jgi:hypothetical protein
MRFRNTLKHTAACSALAVLLASVAVAQEYQILQARYGIASRNVDVTQRLRELAARDARFRMGNSTFGVDPARGHVKTLRIFARGPRGVNRIFEYREGSIVDGSMFSGWGGGNWGGGNWNGGWNPGPGWSIGHPGIGHPGGGHPGGPGSGNNGRLQILSAKYGAGRQQVDVTGRLQSLVNNGRLNVQVNNGSLGVGDPAPNTPKNLFVSYSVGNGQRQTRTVQEGSYLTLP